MDRYSLQRSWLKSGSIEMQEERMQSRWSSNTSLTVRNGLIKSIDGSWCNFDRQQMHCRKWKEIVFIVQVGRTIPFLSCRKQTKSIAQFHFCKQKAHLFFFFSFFRHISDTHTRRSCTSCLKPLPARTPPEGRESATDHGTKQITDFTKMVNSVLQCDRFFAW